MDLWNADSWGWVPYAILAALILSSAGYILGIWAYWDEEKMNEGLEEGLTFGKTVVFFLCSFIVPPIFIYEMFFPDWIGEVTVWVLIGGYLLIVFIFWGGELVKRPDPPKRSRKHSKAD